MRGKYCRDLRQYLSYFYENIKPNKILRYLYIIKRKKWRKMYGY